MPDLDSQETGSAEDATGCVLIVGPLAPADGGTTTGGVATHVSDLARNLASLGWKVGVAAGNLAGRSGEPTRHEWGIAYPPVRAGMALSDPGVLATAAALARVLASTSRIHAADQRLGAALGNVLGIARAIREVGPDVVHYHHAELRPFYGRLARVDLPTVITAHSLSAFRDGSPTLQSMAESNLARADVVVTVSTDAAEAVAERVPGVTPRIVPNGIDVSAFSSEPTRPIYDGPRPLVLYLGWIAEYKGVRDLVEATTFVRRELPGAVLALAGPDIDMTAEEAVSNLPPDACLALGTLDADGVRQWLHAADVLVLPSRVREGQPRVLLEAMAAGTPIVATQVGGVGELLDGGRLGVLVEPDAPMVLADAIVGALSDEAATSARTRQAADAVHAYDSRTIASQVAAAYRNAIAIHHSAGETHS